jgi:diaminopimelate decarboxylase
MPNFSLPPDVFERAAAQFQTPFHLYDERGIRMTARRLNEAFCWAPDFKEYFAVKALPNPRILDLFKQEGCGVDCSSRCELMLAERCGFSGQNIMFSANAMPPDEFDLARRLGAYVNLDDISDIDTLNAHGGVPETVCVRFNPGGDFSLGGNQIMGRPGESKYGWTRAQLVPGLKKLKSLGAKGFGLHAFLASNMTDPSYYPALAGILFGVAAEVSRDAGLPLRFVNLSGGVGIPYTKDVPPVDIMGVGAGVRQQYIRVFGTPRAGGVAIKTELGRFMTGPYGFVVTRATHEKNTYKHFIGVDACAVQLIRPAMYGAYHEITVVGRETAPATETYDITGCLCENNDKFAINRKMPPIHPGDLLVIHDAGAHAFSMGYQYNGRLRTAEILYREDGSFQMIRRPETPEDYFSTLL